MASAEVLLANAYDFNSFATSGAGASQDITIAAPASHLEHVVQGVEFSFSAAPAAAVEVQLIEDLAGAATVIGRWQVPASAVAPISLRFKGINILAGKSVTLRIPAPGGATVSSGGLLGMTRSS